jgi:predicted DNA-binding WGR domain protein
MQAEIRLVLQARNPARNIHRAWTVEAGPDLFGAWLVLTRYGRIGAEGRRLARSFADESAAGAHIAAALRRRATSPRRLGVAYDVVTK